MSAKRLARGRVSQPAIGGAGPAASTFVLATPVAGAAGPRRWPPWRRPQGRGRSHLAINPGARPDPEEHRSPAVARRTNAISTAASLSAARAARLAQRRYVGRPHRSPPPQRRSWRPLTAGARCSWPGSLPSRCSSVRGRYAVHASLALISVAAILALAGQGPARDVRAPAPRHPRRERRFAHRAEQQYDESSRWPRIAGRRRRAPGRRPAGLPAVPGLVSCWPAPAG